MSEGIALHATPVVDAYRHVGWPRYGTAEDVLAACDTWGVNKAVLVLGPFLPDIPALFRALSLRPEGVRTIGIPYGDTPERRLACVEACLTAGAIGIRLQGDDPLENPGVMRLVGERGGWAYAIDPLQSSRHTDALLEWLALYPAARIAAPHFVGPDLAPLDAPLAEELCRHARFFAILSRQGQKGSREPYPYADLRPWVERVLAWCGPERMLWGSEYPVLCWRGEQIDQTQRWLLDLGVSLGPDEYRAILGGNGQRLFFDASAPPATMPELPDWVRRAPLPGPVVLSPTAPLELPYEVYEPLFRDYARRNRPESPITFPAYLVEHLRERARALGGGGPRPEGEVS